jgi:hypothetical protein
MKKVECRMKKPDSSGFVGLRRTFQIKKVRADGYIRATSEDEEDWVIRVNPGESDGSIF